MHEDMPYLQYILAHAHKHIHTHTHNLPNLYTNTYINSYLETLSQCFSSHAQTSTKKYKDTQIKTDKH